MKKGPHRLVQDDCSMPFSWCGPCLLAGIVTGRFSIVTVASLNLEFTGAAMYQNLFEVNQRILHSLIQVTEPDPLH